MSASGASSRLQSSADNSFADREFYQDWWNSTSWDQFSRKWNKPVHTFLLRHVYASTMSGFKLSRTSATFVTFLLSALCHELVMAVVTKKIRPYLFLMQVSDARLQGCVTISRGAAGGPAGGEKGGGRERN